MGYLGIPWWFLDMFHRNIYNKAELIVRRILVTIWCMSSALIGCVYRKELTISDSRNHHQILPTLEFCFYWWYTQYKLWLTSATKQRAKLTIANNISYITIWTLCLKTQPLYWWSMAFIKKKSTQTRALFAPVQTLGR